MYRMKPGSFYRSLMLGLMLVPWSQTSCSDANSSKVDAKTSLASTEAKPLKDHPSTVESVVRDGNQNPVEGLPSALKSVTEGDAQTSSSPSEKSSPPNLSLTTTAGSADPSPVPGIKWPLEQLLPSFNVPVVDGRTKALIADQFRL